MSGRLEGRLIGLGVCGSIAAYKAVELLRLLRTEGAEVVVMLTPAATQFVGPLTFAALSRHAVETDVLGLLPDQRIGHIVVADAADALVVAPATARWLGSMANGIANDTVTAACLATSAPVVVAPAMDGDMWTHRATQDNVERLERDFGYRIVPPEIGSLASGQSGIGRLADLPLIIDELVAAIGSRPVRQPDAAERPPETGPRIEPDLEGRHVVVSAGGTAEAIDPVRFIGNRSTGRMGVAIAEAALARGARVTMVAGRVEVPLPGGAVVIRAESTAEMRAAVVDAVIDHPADVLVMAAAVADFRPRRAVGLEARPRRGTHAGAWSPPRTSSRRWVPVPGSWIRARSSWGSPPRPDPWTGRRTSSAARGRTSSSPTTSPRQARGSARTPTGS